MALRNWCLWIFTCLMIWGLSPVNEARADNRSGRIVIEYGVPESAEQRSVYALMKTYRALEIIQELFSPFRLPIDIHVKTKSCGKINAWYQRNGQDAVVTICYEYVSSLLRENSPSVMPAGLSRLDAIKGQFLYVAAHEMGHAVFDVLDIPTFGRPEDVADQFATYILLQLGQEHAWQLIMGAAYSYAHIVVQPSLTVAMKAFSDMHGSSAQRYYNLLCLAYGAQPDAFADVVAAGMLPEARAKSCAYEYSELAFAFRRLVRPHLDPVLVKQVLKARWIRPEPERRPSHRPITNSTDKPVSVVDYYG